jgi:hypothetical protein
MEEYLIDVPTSFPAHNYNTRKKSCIKNNRIMIHLHIYTFMYIENKSSVVYIYIVYIHIYIFPCKNKAPTPLPWAEHPSHTVTNQAIAAP